METKSSLQAYKVLFFNTLAFTVCFAAWMQNGVLVTFLIDNGLYAWDKTQMGWLIGIPVLTGSVLRLPLGVLTDKFGGRIVFPAVMLVSAVPMYLVGFADRYLEFLLAGLGFGLTGASFAVGVAYTSLWFPKEKQGTALGIFGIGTAGTALTSMGAPFLLRMLTDDGAALEGWRTLPKLYALALVVMAILFFLITSNRKVKSAQTLTLSDRLKPLRNIRIWRFGLYYFFTFGGFVAVSQWLIPYYVNVYSKTITEAGLIAAFFILPAGILRALGGWMSDRLGARSVMYFVLIMGTLFLIFLFPPRMELKSPGQGISAASGGTVTEVTDREIVVGENRYILSGPVKSGNNSAKIRLGIYTASDEEGFFALPITLLHQEAVVKKGDIVTRNQLLARGVTQIYFQANVWIFTLFVLILGIAMGMGSGAVYKHIPHYFPQNVGLVGGLVGVIGGLGGFFGPIIFGYLLKATGIWTTCWMFLFLVAFTCLIWMHRVVRRMIRKEAPGLAHRLEGFQP